MPDNWIPVDLLPPLKRDEVQLWRIELNPSAALVDSYAQFLSADEQIIAKRRRAGETRDHFTLGRACLRILLGNALGIKPENANIANGPHGKPEIASVGGSKISFNVAHSKNTVLIALGLQGAMGVDIEYFDRSTDIIEVAQANFTAAENHSLAVISDTDERLRTFYRYWTRKEAIGKADGRGLLLPMATFDVSFGSMDSHPVAINDPASQQSKLYFVSDLNCGEHAAGALALESSECRIQRLSFPLLSFFQGDPLS
jgi:4'-phosphopantetheinyl transferase